MSKGSDLLGAALANEGVDRVFGVPAKRISMWRCMPPTTLTLRP